MQSILSTVFVTAQNILKAKKNPEKKMWTLELIKMGSSQVDIFRGNKRAWFYEFCKPREQNTLFHNNLVMILNTEELAL